MATLPVGVKPLDVVLPIRAITIDGVVVPFANVLDLDGAEFAETFEVIGDDGVLHLTTKNKGVIPDDDASFGSAYPVTSKLVRVSTTNATPFAALSYTIPADEMHDIVVTVIGKKRGSLDRYRADLRATVTRNSLVSAALDDGTPINVKAIGTLATATCAITLATFAVEVTVTGVAANIDWSVAIQIQPIGVPAS
jgi:hypothetical protein